MINRYIVAVACLFSAAMLFSQSRDDVRVYVSPVTGGLPEQQEFFAENFRMELTGANYAVVENQGDSDYTMNLSITQDVEESYEDEDGNMTAERVVNVLSVSLLSTEDGREIIQLSWGFETLEEMYDWNLLLIYQVMANVPLTKIIEAEALPDTTRVDTPPAEPDHWRDKWLYLRASFDYPITFYAINPETSKIYTGAAQPSNQAPVQHKVRPFPGATVGLEFQFLSWASIEGGLQINFGDPIADGIVPILSAALKIPLKPSQHFMIEPYGIVAFPLVTVDHIYEFPKMGAGGGIQFGVKGGKNGAFFAEANYIYYLGDVIAANAEDSTRPYPARLKWNRFVVDIGIGYKIGFINRRKP
jgi:hypothetical protein